MNLGHAAWLTLGLGFCVLAAGCGYTQGELFREDVATVAVPVFGNQSFYRGMEMDLTEALAKELERRTPYKVVRSNNADTILEGKIVSVRQRRLSRTNRGNLPQEMQLHMVVDFQWRNARTGEVMRERKGFEVVGRYIPASPIAEPLAIAQRTAVAQAAGDIVSTLRSGW